MWLTTYDTNDIKPLKIVFKAAKADVIWRFNTRLQGRLNLRFNARCFATESAKFN